MEPISHVSMKKQPLLSVRHLEKRIVSTKFQVHTPIQLMVMNH